MGIVRSSIVMRPYDNLLYALKVMVMEYIPKAVVTDEKGFPLGIITQKDIINFVYKKGEETDFDKIYVSEVMKKDIVCVGESIDPLEAAQIMIDKRQPMLVVCSDEGKALGIIIKTDLTQYYAAQIKGVQKVREYMSTPAIAIGPDDSVIEAVKTMVEKDISRVIIVDNDRVSGLLTTTDLLYLLPALKYKECKVSVRDSMSPNIIVVEEEEDLNSAAKLMASRKIKGIPVVEGDRLKGVITTTDVTKALLDDRVRKYLYEVKMYTSTF
ncbi:MULTISPECIES: CBS domain-containing protein [Acidianus]|uniref:Histidine kinase n=1 Tax=Candidatus Acidianus copahuensis TaxID=1160895 RepID=A0A031LHT7_9CREN|nr:MULTISPECIES: CBS domain-containing protein [Acidianus]EZQ01717.1 histidine kinase [Candidatus Acidianus copahuensis]NON63493.1 CBS domain-containing protein [Acidianus sp. RZ1]